MIFVTLGTGDKLFDRLLEEVERLVGLGVIQDEVVVQAGNTKFQSKKMKIYDLLPMEEMERLTQECSMLITHGGVGSIISGLKHGKCVVAVPRLAKFNEVANDHQLQIIGRFQQAGYLIGTDGVEGLADALKKAETFVPQQYKSNTENMIALIKRHIEA